MSERSRSVAEVYRFFTAPSTRQLIHDLGLTLIGYRALRDLQRRLLTC
jgi:hypothetical protein